MSETAVAIKKERDALRSYARRQLKSCEQIGCYELANEWQRLIDWLSRRTRKDLKQ